MTRAEFVDFVRATFNAMDMITPVEGATAVIKAFDEYESALRACADAPPSAIWRTKLDAAVAMLEALQADGIYLHDSTGDSLTGEAFIEAVTKALSRMEGACADALAPAPADEEMVPHAFNLRTHPQVGEEIREGIWCKDCEYHRDHAIHRADALAPPEPPLATLLELNNPHPVPIRVAAFLRHYASIIRKNEHWDIPETMARTYESAAMALESYQAALAPPTDGKLFRRGTFVLHGGGVSTYKIDCDALSDGDIATLAAMVSEHVPPFGAVEGVPTGGTRLAQALEVYCAPDAPLLIADDVLTTGGSMERQRDGRPAHGVVLFARGPCPSWITPLFTTSPSESSKRAAALDAAPREEKIDESRSPDGDGHREQSTEAGDSADSVAGGSPRPQGNVHARSAISDAGAAVPALTDERLAGSEPADSRASVQPRRYSTREILQDAGATHTHGGTLGWNPSWIKAADHDRVIAAAALDAAPSTTPKEK